MKKLFIISIVFIMGCNQIVIKEYNPKYASLWDGGISADKMMNEYGFAEGQLANLIKTDQIDSYIDKGLAKSVVYKVINNRDQFIISEYWIENQICKIEIKGKIYRSPLTSESEKGNIARIDFGKIEWQNGKILKLSKTSSFNKQSDISKIIDLIENDSYVEFRSESYRHYKEKDAVLADSYLITHGQPSYYIYLHREGEDELLGYYYLHINNALAWGLSWFDDFRGPIYYNRSLLNLLLNISIRKKPNQKLQPIG